LAGPQAEEAKKKEAKAKVDALVSDIIKFSQEAANNGLIDKEKYIIPPHLHDLQEADLPETQRGLVISEIAQFRERAAKREREKMRDVRDSIPTLLNAPSGPKQREWGKPQNTPPSQGTKHQGFGKGSQGYNKPPGFVKSEDSPAGKEPRDDKASVAKTDEDLEAERKEQRRQEEELSFKDVRCIFPPYFHDFNFRFVRSEKGDMSPEKGLVLLLWRGVYFAIACRRSKKRKTGSKSGHASKSGMMTKVMKCFMLTGKLPFYHESINPISYSSGLVGVI
jgi:hypothetical protein